MFELIQELKDFIAGLNLFALVDIYRNEFAQGSDWNPVFPCCLIRLDSMDSTTKGANTVSANESATVILYVAQRLDDVTMTAMQLAESLWDAFENFDYGNYIVSANNVKFFDTGYGTDIYTIQITISE